MNEYGQPIIFFDGGNTKERIRGVDAYRVRTNLFNIFKNKVKF